MTAAGWPKMAFIEKKLAGDPTNWWAANHAAAEAMLRSSGMRILARPADEIYVCQPAALGGAMAARSWDAEELFAATGRTASIDTNPWLPTAPRSTR
jgi:tRNA (mo5U34)-methyltransferase